MFSLPQKEKKKLGHYINVKVIFRENNIAGEW